AWRDCEGISPRAGLMRIAQQTSLDFRIVRYWFYCRSNYEGIARAFDALGPRKKLEFPKLEEYYLFDKFTDDLHAPDTASQTPQALGPSHGASTTSNQRNQPAHAQAESSSSAATQGRVRRASTTTKKKPQKPSTTTTKKRKAQRPTQEPNENGKRRQDPASEDREVKAASRARTKRTKVAAASAAPPPPSSETLPEAGPVVSRTAETDVTAAPSRRPSDPFAQNTATEAGSILSVMTSTPSDMDSTPSLSATATQNTVAPTSSPSEGAADVHMEDMTSVANCNPSSTATAATQSKARRPKMIMAAVVIPPYKGSSSGSPSPTSNRRQITTLRLPPSVMQSINAVSTSAPGADTPDASTSASTPKLRIKLIRNRMEPYKHSRRNSNSEESTNPSINNSGANLAIEQELELQSEKLTATDASAPRIRAKAKAKAKAVTGPKRRAQSTTATSESEPNTASMDIQLRKRSKSAPLSASKDGEPGSHATPESEDSREQTLNDSDQNGGVLIESRSHVQITDTALVPVEKETPNAIAGAKMVREAEDKEVDAMEDQEEGHLGTVRSGPSVSSKASSSLQSATLTVTSTRGGGDIAQGEKQDKRLPEQQRSTRMSRSRARGPSTTPSRAASQAPSQPRVSLPDSGALIEPTQIMPAQCDVVDTPEGEGNGPAVTTKGQQDKGTSAQLLWEQPWTKQYASIKPMKRRNTMVENGTAPCLSKSSPSASITNSSNSGNNTMAPDERMASEKKIISMDQTPPTPKSTDDTDRQARTPQNKEFGEFKNSDCRQPEDKENPKAASTTVSADGIPYMKAQTNEMDVGGSSYSPDATYDCFSPTDPYHSDDSWSEGSDVKNDILTTSATRGRHRKNASPADDLEEEITDLDIQADRTAHGTMETTRGREDTDEDRIGPVIVLEARHTAPETARETALETTRVNPIIPKTDQEIALEATRADPTIPVTDQEIDLKATRADPTIPMTGQEIALVTTRADPVIPLIDQETALKTRPTRCTALEHDREITQKNDHEAIRAGRTVMMMHV
ncbi:hypothetical protein BGZ68_010354, partial [Mortierella alpina]